MTLKQIIDDTRGSTIIEVVITFSLFILLIFGLTQAGLILWTQAGLQHAVDMAARCASVNDAAISTGISSSLCWSTVQNPLTQSTIQTYAANNAFGLNPPTSAFTFNAGVTCGTGTGNKVTASYTVNLIGYLFSPTLRAQSCYPG